MGTRGSEPESEVEEWVAEFIGRHEADRRLSAEEFVLLVPERIRAVVLERCRIYVKTLPELVSPSPDRSPPDSVGGYRLESRIGAGGMGTVYLARSPDGHRVAVKLLHPNLAPIAAHVLRFWREASTAGRLQHPGIVPVIDAGFEHPWHYLVMEFVEGGDLAKLLEREGSPGLDPRRTASLVRAVALALDHAHRNGVTHRDVKPHNILIDGSGAARLSDFGLAQVENASTLTLTGQWIGTLQYMSPELALARRVKVDHRTDVYSLGAVLYELLTGRRPFESKSQPELHYAITFTDPEPPTSLSRAVPRDLERVCLQALEKRPNDRYRTAADMAADLERVLLEESPLARKPTLLWRTWRRARRRPLLPVAVTGILAASALSAWAYVAGTRERTPPALVSLAPGVAPAAFEIRAFRLDPSTHAAEEELEFATRSSEPQELPPGIYRFVVRHAFAPDDGFAELTRTLRSAQEVVLAPRVVSSDVASAEMLRIPSGTYRVGTSAPYPNYALEVQTSGFLIDRSETSNGEYAEFLASVPGAARPQNWPEGPLSQEWLRRPVIRLPFEAVQAYCEWRGKRLPTWIEWEIAATGPDCRPFPWAADGEPTRFAVVGRPSPVRPSGSDQSAKFGYLEETVPVDVLYGADVSPFGLLHVYGNVREWTENHPVRGTSLDLDMRLTKGFPWYQPPAQLPPLQALQDERGDFFSICGFRCAKSIDAEKSLQLSTHLRTEERK